MHYFLASGSAKTAFIVLNVFWQKISQMIEDILVMWLNDPPRALMRNEIVRKTTECKH